MEAVVSAAASLELIHRTSLIFDDIQDQGRERNNRPTVWALWGPNQAINAGLALSCIARMVLQRMRHKGIPDGTVLGIMSVLEMAAIELCRGQFRDISFMDGGKVEVGDYLDMVRGKTAALFGVACEVAALCTRSTPTPRRRLVKQAREFGLNLGIAFQIVDDYLGIWGDEALVGKTANDLVEEKRSLPVVLALEIDPHQMQSWLDTDITLEDAAIIRSWMESKGIPERVKNLATEYHQAARGWLDALPLQPEWRERIQGFLALVTERTK